MRGDSDIILNSLFLIRVILLVIVLKLDEYDYLFIYMTIQFLTLTQFVYI